MRGLLSQVGYAVRTVNSLIIERYAQRTLHNCVFICIMWWAMPTLQMIKQRTTQYAGFVELAIASLSDLNLIVISTLCYQYSVIFIGINQTVLCVNTP
jgi:hypothetical protein